MSKLQIRGNRNGFYLLVLFVSVALSTCVVYEPVPVPAVYPGSSYDIAWENAQRAAEDAGIQVTSTDKASGTIFGKTGQTDATIYLTRQRDGRIRVELNLSGPSRSSYVAEDFYRAFDRRMGKR